MAEITCKPCSKSFETERGFKSHKTKVHKNGKRNGRKRRKRSGFQEPNLTTIQAAINYKMAVLQDAHSLIEEMLRPEAK